MQYERKSASRGFFFQDARDIVVRLARMDHQRQPGFPRGSDMAAKAALLPFHRTVVAEIIETSFPDRDNIRVLHEVRGRDVGFLVGVVRMRADRAEDVVIGLSDPADFRELMDLGADGHHPHDAMFAGTRNDGIAFGREVRKIQMTMAVHQHRQPFFSSSSR